MLFKIYNDDQRFTYLDIVLPCEVWTVTISTASAAEHPVLASVPLPLMLRLSY